MYGKTARQTLLLVLGGVILHSPTLEVTLGQLMDFSSCPKFWVTHGPFSWGLYVRDKPSHSLGVLLWLHRVGSLEFPSLDFTFYEGCVGGGGRGGILG